MYWLRKESTLWLWLPLSASNGKEDWSPSIQMHSYKPTVKRDDCSLQRAFKFPSWRLLLLSAAGKVAYARICSFTSVRASLCCLHCLNASFLLTHLVLTTESLGVHSSRHMVRGRWSPSLCALPYLHTLQQSSSSPSPQFSVFCHTSASCLDPHSNSTVLLTGFPCSSFQCFFHLVFDSFFVGLKTAQSPHEPVKLHGQYF